MGELGDPCIPIWEIGYEWPIRLFRTSASQRTRYFNPVAQGTIREVVVTQFEGSATLPG